MRGNFITDRNGCKNPNYKHGLRNTRLFSIWSNIKTRCLNSNTPSFKHYGFRGIKICKEWLDFKVFYDWSISNGYSDNLTIDRINNNGIYEPSNCRWVDMRTQTRNTRNNHFYTIDGVSKPLIEWCEIYKINYKTVRDRLKRKWSIERALTEKVQIKFRRKYNDH